MSTRWQPGLPSFGGWYSYQKWADHDFLPRPHDDEEADPSDEPQPDTAEPDQLAASEQTDVMAKVGGLIAWPDTPADEGTWTQPDRTSQTLTLVRPYARTGGRTHACHDLALETLVSVTSHGCAADAAQPGDYCSICRLCGSPQSVAEIAARLRLPLGVARVLLGDMAEKGLILIHNSDGHIDDRHSLEFLERVLSGLRRL